MIRTNPLLVCTDLFLIPYPLPMSTIDHTIEVLNSLLRGELSAVETYSQAIHKFPGSPAENDLQDLRSDHLESVETLRELILELGGIPSTDSGPWGGFAKSVESIASLFGETSAISALKQGEEHGINEYEDVLEDKSVDAEVKELIIEDLLPPLRKHLRVLDSLTE